jgi:hypothetical protein
MILAQDRRNLGMNILVTGATPGGEEDSARFKADGIFR